MAQITYLVLTGTSCTIVQDVNEGHIRGNSSTAVAGSVASAVRFLAKSLMTGHVSQTH